MYTHSPPRQQVVQSRPWATEFQRRLHESTKTMLALNSKVEQLSPEARSQSWERQPKQAESQWAQPEEEVSSGDQQQKPASGHLEIVLRLTVASGLWLTVSTHIVPAGRCGSPALKAQQAVDLSAMPLRPLL